MAHYGLSVHGNSVMVESPGPPSLVDIPGVPRSAVLGYRRGWGNTFRGAADRGNIFHFAVPSLNHADEGGVTLGEVQVLFHATGTCRVTTVHLWDGPALMAAFGNLAAGGNHLRPKVGKNAWLFATPPPVTRGLGISVFVDFGASVSDILFGATMARKPAPEGWLAPWSLAVPSHPGPGRFARRSGSVGRTRGLSGRGPDPIASGTADRPLSPRHGRSSPTSTRR
jgi:hypothetical protein